MEIQRIDTYADSRFSECALFQHGCFLVEGKPYEIEIISDFEFSHEVFGEGFIEDKNQLT